MRVSPTLQIKLLATIAPQKKFIAPLCPTSGKSGNEAICQGIGLPRPPTEFPGWDAHAANSNAKCKASNTTPTALQIIHRLDDVNPVPPTHLLICTSLHEACQPLINTLVGRVMEIAPRFASADGRLGLSSTDCVSRSRHGRVWVAAARKRMVQYE
jgi:hypothetical protein